MCTCNLKTCQLFLFLYHQTCVARAWDLSKPLLFAPAMNTHMWDHPITREQVGRLTGWGYIYIPVVEKTLMCGDKGIQVNTIHHDSQH
ncbi:hypothetical protein DPMN_160033 [Dreissena polymorpha]|uniref:Phosphopantothenoylcysteine decarboxylase n=1 Tax=Dreissena polymorpha TaxID=45954 RepID=A0A9D4IRA9_DREPO|nr:hypothetical protein DPMN_160033 [Dreissena polymorpha]